MNFAMPGILLHAFGMDSKMRGKLLFLYEGVGSIRKVLHINYTF